MHSYLTGYKCTENECKLESLKPKAIYCRMDRLFQRNNATKFYKKEIEVYDENSVRKFPSDAFDDIANILDSLK